MHIQHICVSSHCVTPRQMYAGILHACTLCSPIHQSELFIHTEMTRGKRKKGGKRMKPVDRKKGFTWTEAREANETYKCKRVGLQQEHREIKGEAGANSSFFISHCSKCSSKCATAWKYGNQKTSSRQMKALFFLFRLPPFPGFISALEELIRERLCLCIHTNVVFFPQITQADGRL